MKYEFKNVDIDTFQLVYTSKSGEEKTLEFKRTIEMAEKLDGIVEEARFRLTDALQKRGKTKDDYVIKKDDGKGHTVYDETNYIQLEQKFIEDTTTDVVNQVITDCFGMSLIELASDMAIDENYSEMQCQAFGVKFGQIIMGDKAKTPSKKDK